MDRVYSYNLIEFSFHNIVQTMFGCDNLMLLHEQLAPGGGDIQNYDVQPGQDQHSIFHKKFYQAILKDDSFLNCYRRFIQSQIRRGFEWNRWDSWNGDDRLLYQKVPTFRVHLPNNKAVGGRSHKDADYRHPKGEINFLVPLTSMRGTSSVFYETLPGLRDFRFKDLDPGQYWIFNGNQCEHGNMPNSTGWTRVSFDFRVIRASDLEKAKGEQSVAYGVKFEEGQYYEAL